MDTRFLQLLANETGAIVQDTTVTTDQAMMLQGKWVTKRPGGPLPPPMTAPSCSKNKAKIKKGKTKVGKDKGKDRCKK